MEMQLKDLKRRIEMSDINRISTVSGATPNFVRGVLTGKIKNPTIGDLALLDTALQILEQEEPKG